MFVSHTCIAEPEITIEAPIVMIRTVISEVLLPGRYDTFISPMPTNTVIAIVKGIEK